MYINFIHKVLQNNYNIIELQFKRERINEF